MKKIWAMLTALALVCAMLPSAMAVELSKEASGLTNNKTTVTLTVGANEEHPVSDVVFVLDKSTSVNVRNAATAMLDELLTRANPEKSTINVGVVVFNSNARNDGYVMGLTELTETSRDKFNTILGKELSTGTNIEAGIRAGMAMLAGDMTTADENKHLVLVTDGVTYLWGTEAPKTTYSELANSIATGTDYLNTDYHYRDSSDYNAYSNAKKWMTAHGAEIEAVLAEGYEVDCKFDSEGRIITNLSKNSGTMYISAGEDNPYTALEIATYKAGQAWQDAADEGYNLYAYADQKYTEQYPWGPNFIGGLDTIGGVSGAVPEDTDGMFDGVKNSILYEIQSGTVTDPIGEYYNFDVTEPVNLTVGNVPVSRDDSAPDGYDVSFDGGKYLVKYDSEDGPKGTITWDIKTPVEQGKAVALSYGLTVDQSKVPTDGYVDAPTNGKTTLTYKPTIGDDTTEEFDVPEFTLGKKESIPTPDKEANGKETIGDVATGDIISFTITTSLPETIAGADTDEPTMLIFRDTMTGLELVDGTIALTINGKTIDSSYYEIEDEFTTYPKYLRGENTFAVAVNLSALNANDSLDNLLGKEVVVLSYQGKVTAGMGSKVNNEAWVNDSNSDTTPGEVTITTGGSGTLMYTIGGAVLLAAAGALLVVNRRKTAG